MIIFSQLLNGRTSGELTLWQLLRNRQLNNLKFRRQHPLKAGFVLDFYCAEVKLGIEIDGGYHTQKEQQDYDAERTKLISEYRIRIIRFTNEQVPEKTEQVLKDIVEASAPPSPTGEGQGVRTKDTVLMLDARKIYRKVTSKVNDFSPEQLRNLICIVGLYRGNKAKFESTVSDYLGTAAQLAQQTAEATVALQRQIKKVHKTVSDFAAEFSKENKDVQVFMEALKLDDYQEILDKQTELIETVEQNQNNRLITEITVLTKALRKPQDKLIKQLLDAIATAAKTLQLGKNKTWKELSIKDQLEQLKALQQQLSGNPEEEEPGLLHDTEYFYKQAQWLSSRFPEGAYADVEGLCKVVTQAEIEAKDWSLSPGRYVGVGAAEEGDVDYEERLKEIHIELEGLNEEAVALANAISENYRELAI